MRKLLVGLFVFGAAFFVTTSVVNKTPEERYVSVVDRVLPTTVTIYVSVSTTDAKTHRQLHGQILGSGVFISPNGHILTCNHLFNLPYHINSVTVETCGGWILPAEVLRQDQRRDLALIKVEGVNYPYAKIGRPGNTKVGQEVIAIGSPLGLSGTVTTGVISATNRDQINYDMIQMSCPINPGNSGGPLFNLKGEIVGINVNIVTVIPLPLWTGLGFSVSASEINRFLTAFKGLEKVYE